MACTVLRRRERSSDPEGPFRPIGTWHQSGFGPSLKIEEQELGLSCHLTISQPLAGVGNASADTAAGMAIKATTVMTTNNIPNILFIERYTSLQWPILQADFFIVNRNVNAS